MFTRGDHVVITANDARRGQTGTVVGEKTAVDDLWVMVKMNGEIEFYKPKELEIARPCRVCFRSSLHAMWLIAVATVGRHSQGAF